jgi:hypothetical protein
MIASNEHKIFHSHHNDLALRVTYGIASYALNQVVHRRGPLAHQESKMKTVAVKFLTMFAVAALLGGVALTSACPADGGSTSDGE